MGDREACDECKQKCLSIHGKKTDPSPLVTAFNKILFGGYDFSKNLFLPRKISQAIPVLVAGVNYILQDTNGQRWEVKLGSKDGELAFREGWNKFYEDHGLSEGYVLAFHYIMNSHFVVEIFDKTGFEKLKFPIGNGKKRKRSEIDGNFNAVGECQNLLNHSSKKQGAAFSGTSDSEARTQNQPMSKNKHLSLENGNDECQHVTSANCDTEQLFMINRDDGSKFEEDRTPLLNHLNSEMQSGANPDRSSDKKTCPNTPAASDAVAGIIDENPGSAKIVSVEPAEVAASTLLNNNNITSERENVAEVDNDYHGRDQVHSKYRIKSSTVSTKRVIKAAARSSRHSRKHPNNDNRSDQIFSGNKRNNEVRKVVKTKPVVSSNDGRLDASAFSFTAIVGSHELLELPTSATLWASIEKKVINLEGPNKLVWPVLYHNKLGIKALSSGWENFFMSNRLRIGDECAFILENVANTIFRIDVTKK